VVGDVVCSGEAAGEKGYVNEGKEGGKVAMVGKVREKGVDPKTRSRSVGGAHCNTPFSQHVK